MDIADLERYLERGDLLGFVKQTHNEQCLGWILLNKRRPHERFLSLLEPGENPAFVAEQESIRQTPYHVAVIELPRAVYEAEGYERDEDYTLKEHHYFKTLNEVEEFLQTFGKTLRCIKWSSEIGGP